MVVKKDTKDNDGLDKINDLRDIDKVEVIRKIVEKYRGGDSKALYWIADRMWPSESVLYTESVVDRIRGGIFERKGDREGASGGIRDIVSDNATVVVSKGS